MLIPTDLPHRYHSVPVDELPPKNEPNGRVDEALLEEPRIFYSANSEMLPRTNFNIATSPAFQRCILQRSNDARGST